MKISAKTELVDQYPQFYSACKELRGLMIPFSRNFGTYREKIGFQYLVDYWDCSAEDPFLHVTNLARFACDWLEASLHMAEPPALQKRQNGFIILDVLEALKKFQLNVILLPVDSIILREEDCYRVRGSDFWINSSFSCLSNNFSEKYQIHYSFEPLLL